MSAQIGAEDAGIHVCPPVTRRSCAGAVHGGFVGRGGACGQRQARADGGAQGAANLGLGVSVSLCGRGPMMPGEAASLRISGRAETGAATLEHRSAPPPPTSRSLSPKQPAPQTSHPAQERCERPPLALRCPYEHTPLAPPAPHRLSTPCAALPRLRRHTAPAPRTLPPAAQPSLPDPPSQDESPS
ncbi:hypothetical protein DPSP01_007269 [Paraphaeosphaeria sporulosa]|uniref:Uncharacterized protein n=1 Tax=Paraphaeosphaeria sporulosa TaxID=1460663 RepID=A0A177C431_9PLEO|nr:uncharacterized protein CC84DRAFT_1007774 [Paraphaeosphaeria sporulosa]OAG02255.1 hypothetical protein CC84DRAFT_1007774 [Paraphaeosphaeria sporulosa]